VKKKKKNITCENVPRLWPLVLLVVVVLVMVVVVLVVVTEVVLNENVRRTCYFSDISSLK